MIENLYHFRALLDLIAGKNRGSVIAALLDDADLIESAYKSAIDSAGSADEEFAKQQQSIEGHVNQLKNTWQTMWNDSLNSNAVKFFVDLAKAIVKVVDVAGILPTIFTTLKQASYESIRLHWRFFRWRYCRSSLRFALGSRKRC